MAGADPSMFDFGLRDPQDVQDEVNDNYQKAQDSPNAQVRAGGSMRQGLDAAFGGNPQVNQAKKMQARMSSILHDVNSSAPANEDPVDQQMRLSHAVMIGMADSNPKAAMAASDNMIKLSQQKKQQALLGVQTQEAQTKLSSAQDEATKARYTNGIVVTDMNEDPNKPGSSPSIPISMFNDDGTKRSGTDIAQQITAARKKMSDEGLSPTTTTENVLNDNKLRVANIRANAQISIAQIKAMTAANAKQANDMSPEDLATLTGQYVIQGPSALSRMPVSMREAVIHTMTKAGITPGDSVSAQAEVKELNSAATTIGQRAGNISILSTSMDGMGKQVIDTLDGLDRTRFPVLNQMIIGGKNFEGDPGEKRYAAAMQSFINEYARVIAGGTNVTSDSARDDAARLLRKADSPAAVRAVVDQLGKRETGIIQKASDQAVEYIANYHKYQHILKIQTRLGIRPGSEDDDEPGATDKANGPQSGPGRTPSGPAQGNQPGSAGPPSASGRATVYNKDGQLEYK